ncbi:MOSC domain-containing protein [Haloarchaeobius litoreus]|uniref:MOSC domain-containing protein n=1 Tax=Haloarchaeobius litoreus TaxID=755306 RepID=A0ABD6DKD7_9EURY|nr:MOSC N-terminal beta barrel domain-containing protein [Haloarchaeobius litoreus]
MPTVASLRVYPVKSLDPLELDTVEVNNGALRHDREYAIVDGDREFVNGKREPALHRIRSRYDPDRRALSLREHGDDDWTTFSMDAERGELNAWLSEFLDYPVSVVRDASGGMPDDTEADGPTVIARETAAAIASWYDDVDTGGMLRRLRPNVVVEAGEPFWEDRLYADRGSVRQFTIGDVEFEGVQPCQRCVVPTRDPDTGAETADFRETFVERREATLPAWANRDRFDHFFRVMVNTRIPEGSWGKSVRVGDGVELGDSSPTAP